MIRLFLVSTGTMVLDNCRFVVIIQPLVLVMKTKLKTKKKCLIKPSTIQAHNELDLNSIMNGRSSPEDSNIISFIQFFLFPLRQTEHLRV